MNRFLFLFFALLTSATCWAQAKKPVAKPHVLLIMADDMGFSDLGCYGSEIETPHLDQLAQEGRRQLNFYNSGRCCPSRAALLTGHHPHTVGLGGMVNSQRGEGPYQGYLRTDIPTAAELFRSHGYRTLMTGKWHVGENKGHWPTDRGFDRYFGLISGANSYYEVLPKRLMLNQEQPFTPPPGFYATDAFADSARQFIRQAQAEGKPFFCYLAFTAPHWPLHAPDSVVARFRARYRVGWDAVRASRLARQQELKIWTKAPVLSPREGTPAWSEIANTEAQIEKMAVYAAMVHLMDRAIGRLVADLKQQGIYDQTLIVFLSDNGGCHEQLGGRLKSEVKDTTSARSLPPGPQGSYVAYGKPWANVSNTPYRLHKTTIHEGGIISPFIAKLPQGHKAPASLQQPGYIQQVLPTLLDMCQISYPKTWQGKALPALPIRNNLFTEPASKEITMAWEHEGNRAIRIGAFKLVALKGQAWELYNLKQDPTETRNLALEEPERVKIMEFVWNNWAKETGADIP